MSVRRPRGGAASWLAAPSTSANTSTVFGLFDGATLAEHWRIATERHRSGDELGALVQELPRPRRRGRHLPVVDGAAARALVRGVRRAVRDGGAARARARRQDRHPDSLRRSARGRARPDRERRRRGGALRRAVHRRRLRDVDELRRRLGGRRSTSAACSRRGSRSRWTRSSRGRRGCGRSTSSSRRR